MDDIEPVEMEVLEEDYTPHHKHHNDE